MTKDSNALVAAAEHLPSHLSGPTALEALPLGLRVMFDDRLYAQVERAAQKLAKAEGFAPRHLLGKTEACFAVVVMALSWKLNPWNVAQATYQTPGGKVGYEGKLCQAILEASGHLEGGVSYEHYGDWSKLPTHEVRKSSGSGEGEKEKYYAARTWTAKDAVGLGVIVRATVKGESKPRELPFDLIDAFPLNSTLWATSAKRQICYTAVRAFANTVVPALFMGVPFDKEDDQDVDPAASARDVSPMPPVSGGRLAALVGAQKAPAQATEPLPPHDDDGVVTEPEAAGEPLAGPADAAGLVTLRFPGKGKHELVLTLEEADRELRKRAQRAADAKDLKWCQDALKLNLWVDDLAPDLKEFLVQKGLECLAEPEAAADLLHDAE